MSKLRMLKYLLLICVFVLCPQPTSAQSACANLTAASLGDGYIPPGQFVVATGAFPAGVTITIVGGGIIPSHPSIPVPAVLEKFRLVDRSGNYLTDWVTAFGGSISYTTVKSLDGIGAMNFFSDTIIISSAACVVAAPNAITSAVPSLSWYALLALVLCLSVASWRALLRSRT
jgi:hypothetical protein